MNFFEARDAMMNGSVCGNDFNPDKVYQYKDGHFITCYRDRGNWEKANFTIDELVAEWQMRQQMKSSIISHPLSFLDAMIMLKRGFTVSNENYPMYSYKFTNTYIMQIRDGNPNDWCDASFSKSEVQSKWRVVE